MCSARVPTCSSCTAACRPGERWRSTLNLLCDPQEHSSKLVQMFEEVFSWLPLATVIDERILVTHGGISDKTDLHYIAAIDRHSVRNNVTVRLIFASYNLDRHLRVWGAFVHLDRLAGACCSMCLSCGRPPRKARTASTPWSGDRYSLLKKCGCVYCCSLMPCVKRSLLGFDIR